MDIAEPLPAPFTFTNLPCGHPIGDSPAGLFRQVPGGFPQTTTAGRGSPRFLGAHPTDCGQAGQVRPQPLCTPAPKSDSEDELEIE